MVTPQPSCIVTGGSGFLGTFLLRRMVAGGTYARIMVLDLEPPEVEDPRIHFVRCDLRERIDVPAPEGCRTLFHLAARCREPGYPTHEYFDVNYAGTVQLADWARRTGIGNIVFTSTMMVFAPADEPKTEESPTYPDTAYGTSKLLAEWVLRGWQGEAPGRRLRIVRPAVIFGLHERNNFTKLYRALKSRRFVFIGRDSTVKSCIYVKDMVDLLLLLEGDTAGRTLYHAAYPYPTTIREITTAFCEVFGWKRSIPKVPYGLALTAARGFETLEGLGLRTGIHHRRIQKLYRSTHLSARAAVEDLGWSPRYHLVEALRDWKAMCPGSDLH